MEKLYVLYDPKCELCCRLKNWILVQRSWIGLAVLEQGSEKARRLFPELERIATRDDLAVISDEGAVYLNVIGLGALPETVRAVVPRVSTKVVVPLEVLEEIMLPLRSVVEPWGVELSCGKIVFPLGL